MYAVLQMFLVGIYFLISYQNKNVDIVINDRELGYWIEIHAENFSNVKSAFCCFWIVHNPLFVFIAQAQSKIVPQEIHSIDLDPSCSYQLAFHLDDGW